MKVALRWLDIVVYAAFIAFVALSGPHVTLWYVGLSLGALFAVPWFLARWQLGAAFAVRPEARQLVTWGLYSRFRHPVYVFGSAAWFGALLALLGWRAVIVLALIVLAQIGRARREERVLAEAFGAEYEEYRSTTWF